jgi:hypothetical protein
MGGETQSAADGRQRSRVSDEVEVMSMIMAIRQALEAELTRVGYRRVELSYGTVWVPGDYGADWLQDGAECVAVFRRSQPWTTSGLCRAVYGEAIYRYYSGGKHGPYWTYSGPDADQLWSPEAAACEAVAVALERQLPVCLDTPAVMHAMGDAGLLPAEGRD